MIPFRIPALVLSLFTLHSSLFSAVDPVAFESFTYTGRDPAFETPLPAGHFRNPILAGFYPDPSICRVPGKTPGDPADYYLINSTFAFFPGIPIFHSRDLVNWTQIGHAIDRPSQLNYEGLRANRGLFAPAIEFHDGLFYIVCTHVDGGGNFLITATDPAGPWSDPIWLNFDGIDPSLFFDDDRRAWLVNNGNPPDNKPLYDGHRAIWIQEFDVAEKKLIGPRQIIVNGGVDLSKKPIWIEGPHLYKRDGWYYLCCAEGGTSVDHSQVILRAKSPTGPFAPWDKNPILTQRDLDGTAPGAITCTGHADLVIGPDGNWWSVFLACRPFAREFWTTGRETFLLPVTWTADGWPSILPPGERVPSVAAAPSVQTSPLTSHASLTGNFTWHDDFTASALSSFWMMLRAPKETWWKLESGRILLTPRPVSISELQNPAFLARRVQHAHFDAETTLALPVGDSTTAGLALFQSETQHYVFGVRRSEESTTLILERTHNGRTAIVASTPLPAEVTSLSLKISADEMTLALAYATTPGEWIPFPAEADMMPVTVQAAGGGIHFTGAVVGPHARLDR